MDEPVRIGPYPVERELGRGGMGIVYLARDTRLQRAVAIKVLPDAFARDPERLARFEREARLLASLRHPNIAGIYGLEEADGHRFLTLEYVEGETLAARIGRGPLPLEDALLVARQIAEALEAAHENGVIHRDLKPGNIKLTPGGEVKVLDFGLAKGAAEGSSSGPNLTQSPTLAYSAATGAGVILGTAAYMSPEQARGKPVDRRTDIWSFGCVLYEMLTARQLFSGETVSDMIAKILEREPDWSRLPTDTPPRVRDLLRRTLDKDAKQRLRDIGEARLELATAIAERAPSSVAKVAAPAARPKSAGAGIAWMVAVVSLALAAVAMLAPWARRAPERGVARFTVEAPQGSAVLEDAIECAISPDGRMVVFVAIDSASTPRLCVRRFDALTALTIPGSENARLPFWSADSRFIAFFADGKLEKVPAAGGEIEPICEAKDGRGGTWNKDDVIVFAPGGAGPLFRVAAAGGAMQPVTMLDSTRHETGHRFPLFLPDGKHFLFTSIPGHAGNYDVWLAALDAPKPQLVLSSYGGAAYVSPGYLVFPRGRSLVAQRFEPSGPRLVGQPVSFSDVTSESQYSGYRSLSASMNGDLAYVSGRIHNTRLVWMDRSGREQGALHLSPGRYVGASLSPDGKSAVVIREENSAASDLWLVDVVREVATRFTFGPGQVSSATWSPDGTQIAFQSNRNGPDDFFAKPADGSAAETTLFANGNLKNLMGWSFDGKYVTFEQLNDRTGWDLYYMPADRSGPPRVYLNGPFNERGGTISPDGRWMLYTSDESGQFEIYVQSFPSPGNKYRVTTGGGLLSGWRRDGREILIAGQDLLSLYSCDVTTAPTFHASTPRLLLRFPPGSQPGSATSDLQRFLIGVPEGNASPATITVALDWASQLNHR